MPEFFADLVSRGNRGRDDSITKRLTSVQKKKRLRKKRRKQRKREGKDRRNISLGDIFRQVKEGRTESNVKVGVFPIKGRV